MLLPRQKWTYVTILKENSALRMSSKMTAGILLYIVGAVKLSVVVHNVKNFFLQVPEQKQSRKVGMT